MSKISRGIFKFKTIIGKEDKYIELLISYSHSNNFVKVHYVSSGYVDWLSTKQFNEIYELVELLEV